MTILNIVILVGAGLFAAVALVSLVRGILLRSSIAQSPYGVGRQERRKSMQVYFLRSVAFAVVALILFGVYGLSARPDDMLSTEPQAGFTPLPTLAPTSAPATATATVAVPTATTAATTATATVPAATATATPSPTITPTPPATAVVVAPAGVYLRETPSADGELIEHLLEGVVVILLEGEETVEEVLWRRVQTQDGREGWVAAELDGVPLIEPQ